MKKLFMLFALVLSAFAANASITERYKLDCLTYGTRDVWMMELDRDNNTGTVTNTGFPDTIFRVSSITVNEVIASDNDTPNIIFHMSRYSTSAPVRWGDARGRCTITTLL